MPRPLRKKRLLNLIRKYLAGNASERERLFVEKYFEHFDIRSDPATGLSEMKRRQLQQRMLDKIHAKIRPGEGSRSSGSHRFALVRAAAAVILLIAAGGIVYYHSNQKPASPSQVLSQPDISPGTNGAILKLSGGKSIVLDTVRNGQLMSNAVNVISKTDSAVSFSAGSKPDEIEYYTLITPRAHQQQIILADGTKVWLNAASSIRFPSAFRDDHRVVEISGEAYFEVARDESRPFVVKVKDMRVEVLGTHFNVMAYADEPSARTTLLEGSVKVIKGTVAVLLKPGQEALLDGQGKMRLIRNVNPYEAVAWKNNLFWFDSDNVQTVMTRLSRWYNVDIRIEGHIPDLFTGSIPRDLPFSKVFEVLQKTGSIHYTMKNHQILVTP